jgi:palmitoyltransferase ZDHHC9/14/18
MPPELRMAELPSADEGGYPPQWQRPHLSAFWTWLLAITMPCIAFFAAVAPSLAREHSSTVPVVSALLLLLSNVFMALTCFTDPGKVPRASSEEIHHMSSMPPRAPHMYVVNGVHVTTKFCETCGIQRPPRCTHCRSSDRCIEKWDHYCPWLGTAIGRRNYAFFVIFVWVTATLAAWVGSFAIAHLRTVGTQLRSASPADALSLLSILPVVHAADWPLAVRALAAAPLSGVLAAYGVVVGLALLVLGCFHCYLIWINQTTYEHVSDRYSHGRTNPFDRGPLLNLLEVCCPALVPPLQPADADTAEALEAGARVARAASLRGGGSGGGSGGGDRGGDSDVTGSPVGRTVAHAALDEHDRREAVRHLAFNEPRGPYEGHSLCVVGEPGPRHAKHRGRAGAAAVVVELSTLGGRARSSQHQHDAWNEDDEDASRFERERSTPQSERSTALSFTPSSLSFTPPSGEPPPSPKAEAWADEGDEDGDDDGPDALALPPGTGAAIESVSLFLQAPQG